MAEGAGGRTFGFRDQVEFHQICRRPGWENRRPCRTNVGPHTSRPDWNWKTYREAGSVNNHDGMIFTRSPKWQSLNNHDQWIGLLMPRQIWQVSSRSKWPPSAVKFIQKKLHTDEEKFETVTTFVDVLFYFVRVTVCQSHCFRSLWSGWTGFPPRMACARYCSFSR